MRFLLLGNLEVLDQVGRSVELTRAKHRQLVGMLLLRANQAVSVDQLVDGMWPVVPPQFAKGNLKTYVSAVRRAVAAAECEIETVPRGYRLSVRPELVDILRFEAMLRASARVGCDAERAVLLEDALGMWRGEALQDLVFEGGPLRDAATRLREKRLAAIQDIADLCVRLGRHREAIDHLRVALGLEPLRERLWQSLMVALYRDGRQAEALSAYREFRQLLVDTIGLEPGCDLQSLHGRILCGDAALSAGSR
ncbi:DNA-binding SARP family transcriptional activator [Actinocorallia herbida]|uniref:DNA-binding SARP family transcriptional activator n=1 Tax=Actinocorallia herbida TaxID=58109 RepID=A0A3N1DBC5_9ACTN|nr:AfsR/SARP family transcriptional regulator [Actinocorallia herbida]ROO90834.1 DNA-binding SARP family transcriptional activator [Actinocorallia herbida]